MIKEETINTSQKVRSTSLSKTSNLQEKLVRPLRLLLKRTPKKRRNSREHLRMLSGLLTMPSLKMSTSMPEKSSMMSKEDLIDLLKFWVKPEKLLRN